MRTDDQIKTDYHMSLLRQCSRYIRVNSVWSLWTAAVIESKELIQGLMAAGVVNYEDIARYNRNA